MMLNVILSYLAVYTILLGILVFVGFFIQIEKEKKYFNGDSLSIDSSKIDLASLVVIIPFRNEEHRIDSLLTSILNSTELPKEFIFVDDHSTDKTAECISDKLNSIPYRLLSLPDDKKGKKLAIRFAIEQSESNYILSLDADIEFDSDYFSTLKRLPEIDMYILPAILKAKNIYENLFEVDLILANASNCGVSGFKRPILASGANLLYRRTSFVNFDQFERHKHIQSGDDIYLLRDFRAANANIQLLTDTKVAVHTETPQSLKEFLHQRLRWIAKTGDVHDSLSTSLAIIQVLFTFCFVVLLILASIKNEWRLFSMLYLMKSTVDMILFLPYFNRIKRLTSWLFIPVYEFILPIYSLIILTLMYTFKPEWKGRKLERNQ
jgi:cellulose synthase/poly-beta-1,6-N-acetylglucosamine synthase-like glycosyltransferase